MPVVTVPAPVQGKGVDLFPEPGAPLPVGANRGVAAFRPAAESPAPVRFTDGYLPFEVFVREQGIDPALLAGDVSLLWGFLSGRVAVLNDPVLMTAAGRFAGNAIAVAHPGATWRVLSEPEIGTTTRSIPVASLVRTMVEHPERKAPFFDMLATWEQEDRDEAEFRALSHHSPVPPLAVPPVPFARPVLPSPTFRDAEGLVIPYGSRWEGRETPTEAYSRVTDPARFAPLALDVDALTEYLRTFYLVDVNRGATEAGVQRIVFRPTTGAPVTMTVDVESVTLEAGALLSHTLPACPCDACDENADTAADDLERTALAIAAGGFREIYPIGHRRWTLTEIHHLDGTSSASGGAPSHHLTAARLHQAQQDLARLSNGWWPAWTLG